MQRQAKLQSGLQEALTTIVRLVNEKRDHIPPVVSSSPLTFPFDITVVGYVLLVTNGVGKVFVVTGLCVSLHKHMHLMAFMPLRASPHRDAASGFGLDTFRRMLTQMQTTPPPMLS